MAKTIWVEKYRPKTIDEYIFQNTAHEEFIKKCITEKNIPHLLLRGHRGTGKTSLAFILKNELNIENSDFLALNASDDNSVEVIRNKIKNFVSTFAMGEFKIVFLDEADYLTHGAQAILRNMLEEYSDNARFILTCNKPHKIIPEIQSRCQELYFNDFNKELMLERAAELLINEKIKVKNLELLEQYIDMAYPDFRKLIQLLNQNSIDGNLRAPENIDSSLEVKLQMIKLIESNSWVELREFLSKNVSDNEWEDVYRFLYEYLHEVGKFKDINKWKAGIVIIADHLYRHGVVADPEINAAAMMIRLGDV